MSLTHGSKPSHTEPRVKTRPTKAEARLARRIKDFESVGHSKTKMHKPGSKNLRNK